jgi:hypothetical protein
MDLYSPGFEECHDLRSAFIRDIIQRQLNYSGDIDKQNHAEPALIPKRLVRYWHDPNNLPEDVRDCLGSWDRLADEGFEFHTFDDKSAAAYIASKYSERELKAFTRCNHPAMRCDYLRLCFILAEGGLYVDADDVLIGEGWREIFHNDKLKVQPLCYDSKVRRMIASTEIWHADLSVGNRIFYINNDPIAAPAGHPVLLRALARATEKLLNADCFPDIQSTTGPGNFTAALAAHARQLQLTGALFDFELLLNWESIAEMRWNLGYRTDARNWRNVYEC